jgi:ribosome-associated translation inhibitor RaiA
MEYEIVNQARDLTLTQWHRDLIERQVRRLDTLVASFPPDAVHLRVIVDDEGGHADKTEVSVRLAVPGRLLTSHEAPFPDGVDEAFDDLRRQLVGYKERLRHEPEYKRKRRRMAPAASGAPGGGKEPSVS